MKMRMVGMIGAGALLAVIAVGAALAVGQRGTALPEEPLSAARFSLTIDGFEIAAFSELVGISSGADPVDFVESSGGNGPILKKLPGKRQPPTIVLKRGLTRSLELSTWHEQVLNGQFAIARRSVSLVMYAANGSPVARYHLENAWPSKLEVGTSDAQPTDLLTETVTLVCDNLQRVAP